jgi:hypothetical protein
MISNCQLYVCCLVLYFRGHEQIDYSICSVTSVIPNLAIEINK